MNTPLRDRFQQTAMKVHELGDIDRAITVGVQRRNRTVAVTTAIAVAAVVILTAVILGPGTIGLNPEPLQQPTPSPTIQTTAREFRAVFSPGEYQAPGRGCYSPGGGDRTACVLDDRYASGRVVIAVTFGPYGSGAEYGAEPGNSRGGTSMVVAGYDGFYRKSDAHHEHWRVDVQERRVSIDLYVEPGEGQVDLTEAHAIIDSMRLEMRDTRLSLWLVFTITTNHWAAR